VFQKVFQGSGFNPLLRDVQSAFLHTRTFKPTSTRGESVETFIIAQKRKFKNKEANAEQATATASAAMATASAVATFNPTESPSPSAAKRR